jgi:hypothetical protein
LQARIILGGVKSIIIPGVIGLASWFELFSVNSIGLPFNSGVLIYGRLILAVLIIWGLKYTKEKSKPGMEHGYSMRNFPNNWLLLICAIGGSCQCLYSPQ